MWSRFIHILADPVDGSKLSLLNDILVSESGHQYFFTENIPVLLCTPAKRNEGNPDSLKDFQYHEHYQKDAEHFDYSISYEDAATNFEQDMLHQSILRRIPGSAEIILDVGCGNGWAAKNLITGNHVVISMDVSTVNPLKVIKENSHPNHLGLVADGLALPFKPNSIDAVIAAEIMEHVVNPALFIDQLYKALKPGGIIIITTPYHEKIEYSLCIHCNQKTPRHAHLHSFHEKNIPLLIPTGARLAMYTFMNKYLLKLRTHLLFRYLPYGLWKQADKFAEFCRPAALRFQIEISKPV